MASATMRAARAVEATHEVTCRCFAGKSSCVIYLDSQYLQNPITV